MPAGLSSQQQVWIVTMVALGLAVSWWGRRTLLQRAAGLSSETQRLASLWVGAVETMMLKGGPLVLQPASSDAESRASFLPEGLPSSLATGVTFALTAFDPPGVSRSREENRKENDELWKVLKDLAPPAVWPGFGVDVDERWREDGFILWWPDDERDDARDRVLAVASDFQQGAIYEYYARDGALRRRTVGAKLAQIDEETPMKRVVDPPSDPLFQLPWAGPDEARG